MANGKLQQAQTYYEEAGTCYAQHEILGPLADNLSDRGKLNVLMGRPALSIEQFKESEAINTRLGSRQPAAIAVSNLGEAYGQLGRYQDALHHLERAVERLEPLGVYFRMATCEKYMGIIWSRLGQPQVAHEYLDKAAAHYERADQKALLPSVYNYKAAAFFQQGKEAEAIAMLEQSLLVAGQYGIRPQFALAKRLLGEALIQSPRRAEALSHLEQAQSDFAEMGMLMEHAACLLALGSYYESILEPEKAEEAWKAALELSDSTLPEIDWRAHIELGNQAGERGAVELAIRSYQLGMDAFKQIRQNFLQPTLAGSYLQAPARVFDRMIGVISGANAAEDTLQFIEETKVSTLIHHLSASNMMGEVSNSKELDNNKAEIDQLKKQLSASLDEKSALTSALRSRQIRAQLKKKIEQYDALKARLERKNLSMGSALSSDSFDLEFFRQTGCSALGEDWMALEYYITQTELISVAVTPHTCQVHSQAISHRLHMALDACDRARRNGEPPLPRDLEILGQLLIPASLPDLSPDTHLLIVPHRILHQIPWSALQPDFTDQPLVNVCTPCIVPSLRSLILLWQRNETIHSADRNKGLLVGLSSFNGLHPSLPLVRAEIAALSQRLSSEGKVLSEEDATWDNLLKTRDQAGLRNFSWLHIASHFSPDRFTGRVSGIALKDGDIWLDQLRDLSPLPGLVTLSACNSNDSFRYEGDERVDLQSACFIAGANTVIGNAWPILDLTSAKLMVAFYDHYLRGFSPARASTQAQREMIQQGEELKNWASFSCAGVP